MFKTDDRPSIESVAGDLSDMHLKNSELEAPTKTIQAKFHRNQEADIGMKHEDSKEEEDFVPDPEIFKVISLKDRIYQEVFFRWKFPLHGCKYVSLVYLHYIHVPNFLPRWA